MTANIQRAASIGVCGDEDDSLGGTGEVDELHEAGRGGAVQIKTTKTAASLLPKL